MGEKSHQRVGKRILRNNKLRHNKLHLYNKNANNNSYLYESLLALIIDHYSLLTESFFQTLLPIG